MFKDFKVTVVETPKSLKSSTRDKLERIGLFLAFAGANKKKKTSHGVYTVEVGMLKYRDFSIKVSNDPSLKVCPDDLKSYFRGRVKELYEHRS